MQEKPLRVLQVNSDFKKGGVQAEIMYPARILSKNRVCFDVMLLTDTVGFYEDEFSNYGEIYRIPLKKKSTKMGRVFSVFTEYFQLKNEMIRFLQSHNSYDAVHCHNLRYNAPCMAAAKKCGVPVRIAYSAVNKPERKEYRDRLYFKLFLKLSSFVLNRCCTHKFGVTQNAADYIFGKGKGVPIKNPTVDFERFNPNNFHNFNDGIIHLLMVGSYSSRKNQKFSVDVLSALVKRKVKADLTFIGYPRSPKESYFPELQQKVARLNLSELVSFLPQDADIPKAMAEATILLVPSLQEGLPNVVLEAQTMGLPCFLSTDVSEDCDCGICSFLPLNNGSDYWAGEIVNYITVHGMQKQYVNMSEWDNRKVCEMYMDIWSGKS